MAHIQIHAERQTIPVALKRRLLLWKVKAAADTGGTIQKNQQDEEVVCDSLPLTLLSSLCVCVHALPPVVGLCLCVCSDSPRQQTPRHRLDHSQAGRQSAEQGRATGGGEPS